VRRVIQLGMLSILSLCFLPIPAAAQLRIIPEVGWSRSASDLGKVAATWGTWYFGRRESSPAFGLSMDILSGNLLRLRVSGLRGSTGTVPLSTRTGQTTEIASRIISFSGSTVLTPAPARFPLQPYLLVGGGMKRWVFGSMDAHELKYAFGREYFPSLVLGGGLELHLGTFTGVLAFSHHLTSSPA
jgi:hypothetical protein